jgi:hypothetical protein
LLWASLGESLTMTTLTYSKTDVDLVNRWLRARDSEKTNAKTYHGDRPCLPAAAMLAVAQRIWRKRRP